MNKNLYEEIFEKVYGYKLDNIDENKAKEIRDHIVALRKTYRSDAPTTGYNEDKIRKAYMLAYYPNYIMPAYSLMKMIILNYLKNNHKDNRLKLVYFAAGPGPEVYGTLKALYEDGYNKRLEVSILDFEKGWQEERQVTSALIKEMGGLKLSTINHISGCDLRMDCKSNCDSWSQCEKTIFEGDLCFIENCINHMDTDIGFEDKLINRIQSLKPGACFVIIDLDYKNVKNVLKNIATKSLEYAVILSTNINRDPENSNINLSVPLIMRKFIFNGSDYLMPKKNTRYYYMILIRK